ncbi:pallilysin-related adhesin [Treponema sp.]|uniref:pallilysin-related adhesin n=1 Tax=Treponema sp. TaxID=166 RepID=UPI00298D998F|nr:pallilysin-related adhesin [Treponema sp.]MCR5614105.1 pallilysin-related adhesin [Treponema sp.]
MKKIIPAIFVVIAAVLATVFFSRRTISKTSSENVPSLVTADSQEKKITSEDHNVTIVEENTPTSFLTLKSDETLLSSMGIDLNGDNLDDEILITKTIANPNLKIVIGIYNPNTKVYVRAAEIRTEVTQFRSFSYNGLDITGEHKTALVYQGFTENGSSVLQMYFCNGTADNFSLTKIGDFKSDGTIFIQQYNRTDTYELSVSSGKSFPVWVYSSDTSAGAGALSQIQTEYDWSAAAHRYVEVRQIKVTGRNLAAKELAKIQDGTVKTFADYLNGLWYQTSSEDNTIRYIFFDYESSEVIFLSGDTQEVYTWLSSTLYKNGIYLSTANISIENLGRRFAVTLTDIDQVRIRAYDDVRMHIGADNLWDGQYKKLNDAKAFLAQEKETTDADEIVATMEDTSLWYTSDGANVVFKGDSYSISTENFNETGVFVLSMINGQTIIQFNPRESMRYIGDTYIIGFKEVPRSVRLRNGKTRTVYDKDKKTIVLKPAVLMASSVNETSGKIILLNAETD